LQSEVLGQPEIGPDVGLESCAQAKYNCRREDGEGDELEHTQPFAKGVAANPQYSPRAARALRFGLRKKAKQIMSTETIEPIRGQLGTELARSAATRDPFRGIIGHERVRESLLKAVGSGRIHHALLFAGRAGIGKRLLAVRFAQLLMCEESQPGAGEERVVACLECRHCRRIQADAHPDILRVEPDGQGIKIAQVRELQKKLTYKPFEARFRVVYIDHADAFWIAAANAILKTLEEPVERTIFVLITDQTHKLLPTIISRCQMVRFAPFDAETVRVFLLDRGVEAAVAANVANLAGGSLERALELAEGEMLARQVELLDVLDRLDPTDPDTILEPAGTFSADKEELFTVILMIQAYFRDLSLVRAASSLERLGFKERAPRMAERARGLTLLGLERAMNAISEVTEALKGNVNARLATEHLLFELALVLNEPRA